MICPQCGNNLPQNGICPQCGTDIQQIAETDIQTEAFAPAWFAEKALTGLMLGLGFAIARTVYAKWGKA